MEKIEIYAFQLEAIVEALRLTKNLNKCSSKETSFDRTVCQAQEYAKNALERNIEKIVDRF